MLYLLYISIASSLISYIEQPHSNSIALALHKDIWVQVLQMPDPMHVELQGAMSKTKKENREHCH